MPTALELAIVLPRLNAALAAGHLLLLWGDVPFPPEAEAPANAAVCIAQWQSAVLPSLPWRLWETPALPLLSLDPTPRVQEAFRDHGVPLNVVATRHEVPVAGQHALLQLAGDLGTRRGLFFTWEDVRAARGDPDKAYLLQEAARVARDGVVLALAPASLPTFARLWDTLLAPALREAQAVYAVGAGAAAAAPAAWSAGISPIAGDPAALLAALAAPTALAAPAPVSAIPAASNLVQLRRLLAQLDDVELDTLCMDHFPAVYDKFARGLRLDEKRNLLLDHCRRHPEAADRVAALLGAG